MERQGFSKNQYFGILDQMPAHIFLISEQGVYLNVFGGKDNNINANYKQYIGKSLFDVVPADLAQLFLEYIQKTLESDQTQVVKYHFNKQQLKEMSIYSDEQGELWIEGVIKPFVMEDGQKVVIWTARNITDKHCLEEKLRELSETDVLTQNLNRRAFMARLFTFYETSKYIAQDVSFLMMDIDYFKRINDTLGHPLGDFVIQHVTNVISNVLRDSDVIGRIGGEEFGVILPKTTLAEAAEIAERLRFQIESEPCFVAGRTINVTVSIGVSKLEHNEGECQHVLTRSDRAMYYSKNHGRNCVTVYSEQLCDEFFVEQN